MLNLIDIIQGAEIARERIARIRVVCVGDSLTGWNNVGVQETWPFPVYPTHLDSEAEEVANFGIAGGESKIAQGLAEMALKQLPNSQIYVIGFGTNDLGMNNDHVRTSRYIISNLSAAIDTLTEAGKKVILLNVPQAKLIAFPEYTRRSITAKREYHNGRLMELGAGRGIPVVDIYTGMKDEYFGDNLHTNTAGAKFIAERVKRELQNF
jgi:lysophospholipase L1-like esterase